MWRPYSPIVSDLPCHWVLSMFVGDVGRRGAMSSHVKNLTAQTWWSTHANPRQLKVWFWPPRIPRSSRCRLQVYKCVCVCVCTIIVISKHVCALTFQWHATAVHCNVDVQIKPRVWHNVLTEAGGFYFKIWGQRGETLWISYRNDNPSNNQPTVAKKALKRTQSTDANSSHPLVLSFSDSSTNLRQGMLFPCKHPSNNRTHGYNWSESQMTLLSPT